MKKRAHWVVTGRVQGVCYRMAAQEEATALGLTGWVRNRSDGSVEIVAEGEEPALARFLEWARRGPPHARVATVTERYETATGEFSSFDITW